MHILNAKYYYNNRVDVRGHKYVFGPTQTHFSPTVNALLRALVAVYMREKIIDFERQ